METETSSWDYKKILLGLCMLGVIGWIGYQNRAFILSYNMQPTKEVAGVETVKQRQSDETKVTLPQLDLQEKITDIAQQVSNLDVKEVTASSPQVQKVLKDMESLKDLPRSQAKDACTRICSGL